MTIYNEAFADVSNKLFKKALKKFLKIIDVMPKHYQSWGNMGICYYGINEVEKSKECYEKAIEIEPEYDIAKSNLKQLLKNHKNL